MIAVEHHIQINADSSYTALEFEFNFQALALKLLSGLII